MEAMFQTLMQQIPNLAVAIWMLYQQGQTINKLLEQQIALTDRLLDYIDRDKAQAEKVREAASLAS